MTINKIEPYYCRNPIFENFSLVLQQAAKQTVCKEQLDKAISDIVELQGIVPCQQLLSEIAAAFKNIGKENFDKNELIKKINQVGKAIFNEASLQRLIDLADRFPKSVARSLEMIVQIREGYRGEIAQEAFSQAKSEKKTLQCIAKNKPIFFRALALESSLCSENYQIPEIFSQERKALAELIKLPEMDPEILEFGNYLLKPPKVLIDLMTRTPFCDDEELVTLLQIFTSQRYFNFLQNTILRIVKELLKKDPDHALFFTFALIDKSNIRIGVLELIKFHLERRIDLAIALANALADPEIDAQLLVPIVIFLIEKSGKDDLEKAAELIAKQEVSTLVLLVLHLLNEDRGQIARIVIGKLATAQQKQALLKETSLEIIRSIELFNEDDQAINVQKFKRIGCLWEQIKDYDAKCMIALEAFKKALQVYEHTISEFWLEKLPNSTMKNKCSFELVGKYMKIQNKSDALRVLNAVKPINGPQSQKKRDLLKLIVKE